MEGVPLHSEKDEKWALQDGSTQLERDMTPIADL
jgi:hypothetical protein